MWDEFLYTSSESSLSSSSSPLASSSSSGREEDEDLQILGIVGCILYVVLLICSLGSLFVVIVMRKRFVRALPGARSTSTTDERKHRASILFHIVVIVFTVSRAWMFFDIEEGMDSEFFGGSSKANVLETIDVWMRKIGFDLHYTTYSVIVYWWVITYNRSFRTGNRSPVEAAKGVLIFLNVLMIAFTFAFVIIYSIVDSNDIIRYVYFGVTSALDVTLSVAVPILAIFVYIRQKDEVWFLRAERHDILRVLWCSAIFFLCNLTRSVFPMYSFITGKSCSKLLFYLFTCIIPETVSTLLQLYILHAKSVSNVHDAMVIESLYNEAKQADGPGTMRAPLLSINKEVMPVSHLYNTTSSSSSSGSGSVSVPYKK